MPALAPALTQRRLPLPDATAVLDALPAMVWVAGTDKGCVFLNRTWSEFTGRLFGQDQGHGWAEAVHPDDLERCIQEFSAAFDRREPFTMQWRLRRSDGEYRHVLDSGAPMHGPDGTFCGYVGTIVDLTERQRLEEDLRQANDRLAKADRAKALFLNAASHELRTPLTPLLMQLQLLRAQAPEGDERTRQGLEVALRSAERLQALVTDILNVARLHDGMVTVRAAPMDLHAAASEVVRSFQVAAKAKGVALLLEGEAPVPIVGDDRRLIQVIANLVSNAIRFTPRGGEVRVRAGSLGAQAAVTVADNGRGIPADRFGELFRPFAQVHDGRGLDAGSGLGLYLSRGIAEAHGGTIEVHSEGVGRGATFRVVLPVQGPGGAT